MTRIDALPKALQRRPDVRALTLRVYPQSPNAFKVPGTSAIYDVFRVDGALHCTCQAAAHGCDCAHALAVELHLQKDVK